MVRQPVRGNPWIDHRWKAVGVTVGDLDRGGRSEREVVERDGLREVLFTGYRVGLHKDECESYYHNLRAQHPQCYIITRIGDAGERRPFLVSLSFDEANAYMESDDVEVFTVPIPPELYRWTEAFVLAHYVPQPRRKRKRNDWRKEGAK